MQLGKRFHLHLDKSAWRYLSGKIDGLSDAAAGRDMVFLDQERVVEAEAMIVALATQDGVFLRQPQARQGFASIEQFDASVGHLVLKTAAASGYAG